MKQVSSLEKWLIAWVVFIGCMIVCRIIYADSWRYVFLLWNIFLAWIPFKISLFLVKQKDINVGTTLLIAVWLLFFPNALYIVTDLIHLESQTNVPTWYDAVLLFSSAIIGLFLAFASLYKVELFLCKRINSTTVSKLMIGCLFLGSFGVYLGRFLRWNSWDVLTDPVPLATEISARFLFPHEHIKTWAITLIFTALFCILYFSIKKLPGFLKEPGNH